MGVAVRGEKKKENEGRFESALSTRQGGSRCSKKRNRSDREQEECGLEKKWRIKKVKEEKMEKRRRREEKKKKEKEKTESSNQEETERAGEKRQNTVMQLRERS